ncbi:unnamed protein product [Coregonus sp. 'balchen']|nr:unnamed protein product [Coregonus sp. 'balchen']
MVTEEKRSKVKKPKFEFPVYEPSLTVADSAYSPVYDQGTSIEDIEDQMDDWLEDKTSQKKKVGTGEDITLLTRSRAKFPGGTPGRWEKIAHELGRSAERQHLKLVPLSDAGLVKLSALKAQGSSALPGKGSKAGAGAVPDSLMTQREDPQPQPPAAATAEGMKKTPASSRWCQEEAKRLGAGDRGRGQRDEDRGTLTPQLRRTAGRSREECMIRLAELVLKRKQAKS